MDLLMEASYAGNIDGLYSAIKENPNILSQIDDIPFVDTPLHVAASAGHTQYSLEIMRLMPSFATKLNPRGFSPIHLALQNDRIPLVIRLVEKDSDLVRVKGREDYTPLHYVAKKGNLELLATFLLVSPKSIEDVTSQNETALHIALKNDMFEAFEFLVGRLLMDCHEDSCYLKKRILNWKDGEGNTVLHFATSKNQLQLVGLLISCKVDINAKNSFGRTALDNAQDQNQTEVFKSLSDAGAVRASSIPIFDNSSLLLRTDQRLKLAAEVGDINALYSIIEEDPCILDRIDQIPFSNTPLHIAASKGYTKFALEMGRLKPSLSRKLNQDGLSPLHLAFLSESSDTAIRLLDEDKHLVRIKGKMGRTPLHIAAELGKLDLILQSLAACPLSMEDVTDYKETALHIAAKNDRVGAIDVMIGWLEYVGNSKVISWTDNDGNTILHIASLRNQIKVVKLLTRDMVNLPPFLALTFSFLIGAIYGCFPFINKVVRVEPSNDKLLSIKNLEGLTAMDILERQGQFNINEIDVMRSYAANFEDHTNYGSANYLKKKKTIFDKWAIGSLRENLLISEQHRSGVITVAVLIATATYQAVLSPPRGLWEADPSSVNNGTEIFSTTVNGVSNDTITDNIGGTSVMSEFQWAWFAIFNTAAFLASLMKINNLLSGGPISILLVWIPLISCYTAALVFISPPAQLSATIVQWFISAMVILFYVKEATKEVYVIRCRKVVQALRIKHRPADSDVEH